jgi:phytoene synthase
MKIWREDNYQAAFEHSKRMTAYFSKSFYFAAKMLPKERRWATFALYGFCRYADNLIDNPRNRSQKEILFEVSYLEKELSIAYRTGESEHPIIGPFIVGAKKYNIPIQYSLELLEGVKMDIRKTRYETFEDLYLFCYRVAAVVGLMMTHVLGCKDSEAFKYAEKLGVAMQLTNIIRDIKEDKDIGRIYFPVEEMRRFNISEDDIIKERMTSEVNQFIRFQVKRAHQYYKEADQGIKMLNPESQFAIYAASKIYQGILFKMEARNYNPFEGRVFVPQMKKIQIIVKEIFRTRVFVNKVGELLPVDLNS